MPDQPPVTITDPHSPGGEGEVLAAGAERRLPRLPRRVVVPVVIAALVVSAGALGVDRLLDHRAEARRAAAAFAVADTVHVSVGLREGGVWAAHPTEAADPGEEVPPASRLPELPRVGRLVVPLELTDDGGDLTEVRDVQVTGTGVNAEVDLSPLYARTPGGTTPLDVSAWFSCVDVAAGRFPVLRSALLVLVPVSGKEHRVVLPLESTPQLAREACLLPDPDALPEVLVEEQHGRLLAFVSTVPRARTPLEVLSVHSQGFALRLAGGPPHRADVVPPGSGVAFDVRARVTSCAAALGGTGRVTFLLAEGERRFRVVATDEPSGSYARSGSAYLRRLAARACG